MNRKISCSIPVFKVHELLRNDPVQENENIVIDIFRKITELTDKGWNLEESFNNICVTLNPKEAKIAAGIAEGMGLTIKQYKDNVMDDGTDLFSIPEYIEKENGFWWS